MELNVTRSDWHSGYGEILKLRCKEIPVCVCVCVCVCERERERETSHSCGISNFHGKLEGKVEQEIESSLRRSDKTSVYLSPSLALPVLTLSSLPISLVCLSPS